MAYCGDTKAQDGEMRILLIGKTGVGKSSTGNALLGKQVFESSTSLSSVTKETQYGEASRFGRRLLVVDTPGFYDADRSNMDIVREIVRIFGFLSPGIHVLLYVMGVDRFTKECIKTKDLVLKTFGQDIRNRIIIVVTHLDTLQTDHIDTDTYLASSGTEFMQFQKLCNNRVCFINNKASKNHLDDQVVGLLDIIDSVMMEHGGQCFTNYHLKLVRAYLRLERKRKKINLSRARKLLFDKAAANLGLQKVVVWDQKLNIPVPITVPTGAGPYHILRNYNQHNADISRRDMVGKSKVKVVSVKGKYVGSKLSEDEHRHAKGQRDIGINDVRKRSEESDKSTARYNNVSRSDASGSGDSVGREGDVNHSDQEAEQRSSLEPDVDTVSVFEALEDYCKGSDHVEDQDTAENSTNRQIIKDKNFFEIFVEFFNSLFTPLLK